MSLSRLRASYQTAALVSVTVEEHPRPQSFSSETPPTHRSHLTAHRPDRHHLPPPSSDDWAHPQVKALLVDAAGTLLSPSEPAAAVYLRYGSKYGVTLDPREVLRRYREAYNTPWAESSIRYVDDGRPFWRAIVAHATGSDNQDMFEEIYEYYARGEAWYVSPGAVEALQRIRYEMNIKTAVVSNFDSRLRRIMRELGISELFDTVVISAEEGVEKPNPLLFEAACERLGVAPEAAVHVGDDRRNDLYGARDAGCFAWLWGADVHNFAEVERRLVAGNMFDSLSGV